MLNGREVLRELGIGTMRWAFRLAWAGTGMGVGLMDNTNGMMTMDLMIICALGVGNLGWECEREVQNALHKMDSAARDMFAVYLLPG
jgi:hypothetical protein